MATGRVRWFNEERGYGFIAPDSGGRDVFVHISVVQEAGHSELLDGAQVAFDICFLQGKEVADNLRLIQRA